MASSALKSLCRESERAVLAGQALLAVLWVGCAASAPGPPVSRAALSADRPYLVSPMRGFPLAVEASLARRIEEAHGALLEQRESDLVAAEVAALLARNPRLHPAAVLAAQVAFLARDWGDALAGLLPVVAELPSYTAAQLLVGRSHEREGDLPSAVEAYRALGANPLAARRARELRPRAAEILSHRIVDALARGRPEDASRSLARLEVWASGETATLQSAAAVAAAAGDRQTELEIVRSLSLRQPEERAVLERLAALEVEVGDPAKGLRTFQELLARYPDDAILADKLARAKFRWRLELLPTQVRQLAEEPELARGDFAALLYWNFPDVRYGRVGEARIAIDVFDHPHREEIVRVVNLGLMEVDADLHEFQPDRPIVRLEALASLYHILLQKSPRLACLGQASQSQPSVEYLCRITSACGLVSEPSDCLPRAVVSGEAAMEMSRKTLVQLGIE